VLVLSENCPARLLLINQASVTLLPYAAHHLIARSPGVSTASTVRLGGKGALLSIPPVGNGGTKRDSPAFAESGRGGKAGPA